MLDAEIETPAGHAQHNTRPNSKVDVHYEATLLYYRPETNELLLIPKQEALAFETHGYEMCKAVDDLHLANMGMSSAIAEYHAHDRGDPAANTQAQQKVDKAEEKLKKANEGLREKIKVLGDLKVGGTDIVELIPIRKTNKTGPGTRPTSQYGKKMTFVRSDKIKSHWRTYKLNKEETKSAKKNILSKDAQGKRKIDKEKLKEQIKDIKPKIKAEFVDFNEHSVSGILFEWAEAFNTHLKYEHQGLGSFATNNVDLSAQAQLMRYMAGVGASSEWNPKEGKAGLKAEAKAEFSLAEGKAAATVYVPHRLGWDWHFTGKKDIYKLGSIRGQLELALSGVVGASAVAELGCEIAVGKEKVGTRGTPAPNKKLFKMDDKGIEISGKAVEVTPGKAELGVFAGAKADATLTGSIQWLNPENKEKEFKDFIKVAPGVGVMAGAALGAKAELSYKDGKFRFLMAANVCVGLGAKGNIACESDAILIAEFVCWFFYQLYHANYEYLDFVEDSAFGALKDLQFLVIQSGKKIENFLEGEANDIRNLVNAIAVQLEKSEKRDQLAIQVLSNPPMLKYSTPETKGMLLYQLTRHGKADWIDSANYAGIDAFNNRKKAVINVLKWVQTSNDLDNVFQHLTSDGSKVPSPNGKEAMRAHIVRFLQLGIYDMDDQLETIEARLKATPVRGYSVAMNNTPQYHMHMTDSPNFTMLAQLDPIDIDDRNSNIGYA